MSRPGQLIRIIHINFVMAKYGLDRTFLAAPIFYPIRFLSHLNPWNWINRSKGRTPAECLRLALEELGPIYVKFGQILSTRQDLLPDDYAEELSKLQDKVPPFPSAAAVQIIQKAYGRPVNELFQRFDPIPLASASIAQVHAVTLIDGREGVIKVLRPNILKNIKRDVSLLYTLAGLVEKYWVHGRRLRPREIVAEFERTILDELDLMREAANASQLRRNFLNSNLLYVPEVYWEFARTNVVVFERISGIPVSDVEALIQQGTDLKKLSERGVEIFFTQVFRDSFFHADMHPGNIFVARKDPKNPKYIGVDFGIMGSLSPSDQRYLAENLIAFFKRDYRRVAILHVESGWVPAGTRVEEFEGTIRAVCEPIFERPLKEISFGQLLLRLFQTARRFHMEVQPQLMLLQKTLLNIEGLGRQLYPDLDLWVTAKPFLEKWLKQQVGPRAFIREIRERSPFWWERMADMPDMVYEILQEKHQQRHHPKHTSPEKPKHHKQKKSGFSAISIISGCVLISAVLINIWSTHLDIRQILLSNGLLLGAGIALLITGWLRRLE